MNRQSTADRRRQTSTCRTRNGASTRILLQSNKTLLPITPPRTNRTEIITLYRMTNDASMTEKFYEAVLTWETNMSTVYIQLCHVLPALKCYVQSLPVLLFITKAIELKDNLRMNNWRVSLIIFKTGIQQWQLLWRNMNLRLVLKLVSLVFRRAFLFQILINNLLKNSNKRAHFHKEF